MKDWKRKEGANAKYNYSNKCNNTSCPNKDYSGCMIGRNFRTCPDYHVRPFQNLKLKGSKK